MESTVIPSRGESNYEELKKNLYSLKLPNQKWSPRVDVSDEIIFVRIEEDYSSYLTVSINFEMNVKVYYLSKILKWIEWDKPKEIKDVESILEIVNRIIYSEVMYMQD